jgi:subtilase family serine protease
MKKVSVFFCLITLVLLGSIASMAGEQTVIHAAPAPQKATDENVCSVAPKGFAHCLAIRVNSQHLLRPHTTMDLPAGYGPADLQNAYKLPSTTAGVGQTLAIVDASDNPSAEKDLATYRAQYHLPACTTSNGCFKKVDQNGGKHYPNADIGWAEEISLDLDMASAVCPNCHILLVEANDASFGNLGQAVETAVHLKANAISNSYGGDEDWSDALLFAHDYNHPGVAITASAGDNGYGVELPAAYNTVTAVGGTSLYPSSTNRGWSETIWNGTGSGCSAFISKPRWQTDRGCRNRTVADVAAVADPNTGVAVYDTFGNVGGWMVFGGTSAASPIIAGIYALAGNSFYINSAAYPYAHPHSLNMITSGNNGVCKQIYLCSGATGYNGPAGLGTPNGISGF